ncbi:unnamed protein product [Lepidochelys olivacea]
MLTSTHYWPGVTKDNANWVTRIWELVGMDLIGPLPVTKDGYQYILTTLDYLSRWVEAFSLRSNSASEVAKGMYKMIVRRGCPQQILTNLGPEFNNKFNLYICERLRIASLAHTTHKPMAWLKMLINPSKGKALQKMVDDNGSNWDELLDPILFSL